MPSRERRDTLDVTWQRYKSWMTASGRPPSPSPPRAMAYCFRPSRATAPSFLLQLARWRSQEKLDSWIKVWCYSDITFQRNLSLDRRKQPGSKLFASCSARVFYGPVSITYGGYVTLDNDARRVKSSARSRASVKNASLLCSWCVAKFIRRRAHCLSLESG